MKKWSIFYTKFTDDELRTIVINNDSIGKVIELHDRKNKGSNHRTLKKRLVELEIDYSHFKKAGYAQVSSLRLSNDNLFIKSNTLRTKVVKSRILKEKIFKYECVICGLKEKWENKHIVLILDHKNGDNTDNRLSNLRLVCPNCNSQLDTHAGKNKNIVP